MIAPQLAVWRGGCWWTRLGAVQRPQAVLCQLAMVTGTQAPPPGAHLQPHGRCVGICRLPAQIARHPWQRLGGVGQAGKVGGGRLRRAAQHCAAQARQPHARLLLQRPRQQGALQRSDVPAKGWTWPG